MQRSLTHAAAATLVLLAGGTARPAAAQTTLPFDHVHLVSSHPDKAVRWYIKHLYATADPSADRVAYGRMLVFFQKPTGAPTAGLSPVDHIGVAVPDFQAKVKELVADGGKFISPARDGKSPLAFVEDPWGVLIEVVQSPSGFGLQHVHLRATDPEQALAWYYRMFGGEIVRMRPGVEGVQYGDLRVLFAKYAGAEPLSAANQLIDHIAWRAQDFDAVLKDLRGKGVVLRNEPQSTAGGIRQVFLQGPDDIKIAIVRRPAP